MYTYMYTEHAHAVCSLSQEAQFLKKSSWEQKSQQKNLQTISYKLGAYMWTAPGLFCLDR